MSDPYSILGVERTADAQEIKRAYRKLAHQHHPDKSGGDESKFKEINAAYQILSDDAKRAQYDRFGETVTGASGGAGSGFGGFNVDFEDLGVNDIFEQFFGGGRGQRGRSVRRGADVGIDLEITFIESAQGVAREVTTRLQQSCTRCHGNGAEPGTPIKDCATCGGSGHVNTTRQTMLGTFNQTSVCPTCSGDGKQAQTPCTECKGDGREVRERTLEIEVPGGIADGQTIRLAGKGEAPAKGGVPGDLFARVHVQPHSQLRRSGNDIHSTEGVSFAEAALGTSRTVTTLTGKETVTIPAGTQPGAELRLSRQGFPSLSGGGTGDHIITVSVIIPKKLSKKQRELLQEFDGAKKKGLFN